MVVVDVYITLSLVDMYKRNVFSTAVLDDWSAVVCGQAWAEPALSICTSDASLKPCGTDLVSQMIVKSWTSRLVRFIPLCLYISVAIAS